LVVLVDISLTRALVVRCKGGMGSIDAGDRALRSAFNIMPDPGLSRLKKRYPKQMISQCSQNYTPNSPGVLCINMLRLDGSRLTRCVWGKGNAISR